MYHLLENKNLHLAHKCMYDLPMIIKINSNNSSNNINSVQRDIVSSKRQEVSHFAFCR